MSVDLTRVIRRMPIGFPIGLMVAALLVLAGPISAQNLSSSSIDGAVTDESGAAVPGVTVTATSSALQVPQLTTVTGSGNHHLMYDTVNGVPNQPVQFETTNAPVEPDNWDNVYSAYVTDQWRVGQRLTFNLGLRYDYQHSFVPEQTRPAGPFAAAATFPRVEVGKWNRLGPRAAVAWDLTGGGKTVVKATYGKFNTEAAISSNYNRYTTFQTVYRWTDPNRNGRYDPGEVNLDTNGPDFISTTSAANNKERGPDVVAYQRGHGIDRA